MGQFAALEHQVDRSLDIGNVVLAVRRTGKQARNNAAFTTATNCSVSVQSSTHNGQLQHMVVPIPTDYTCDPSTLGGCWFAVQVTFTSGGSLADITTWDANIGGDPVRLIE